MANGWTQLAQSVFSEICPCDNCIHYKECKTGKACYAFMTYQNNGRFTLAARKNPIEKMYIQIFKTES